MNPNLMKILNSLYLLLFKPCMVIWHLVVLVYYLSDLFLVICLVLNNERIFEAE